MQTRSFTKPFELVDYTETINMIPNTWGLINELGIFQSEPVSQHSLTVEKIDSTLGILVDKVRGERNTVNRDDNRGLFAFAVPHFPQDDYVTPQDVQGKRAYGSADAAETLDAVIARKLNRIRMNHAVTLERARAYAITHGAVFAPNGTVSGDYFTTFGITRKVIDYVFGTSTTDVLGKIEEGIAHIQDNIMDGSVVNEIVVLCSPVFFQKLINHATVKEAYKYYTSTQEPLRNRLGSGLYRRFVFGGATFIEYRGSYNGTALIPSGDAYMIPRGTSDTFVSYFSPANKFDFVNTLGEEVYTFSYADGKGESIQLQSESNHLHLLRRPAVSVRLHSST